MKNCPNCNYPLDKDYNFCPSCGFDLKSIQENIAGKDEIEELKKYIICDVCGEEIPEDSAFCSSCGAKVTGKEKSVLKNIEKKDAEKREVNPAPQLSSKAEQPASKSSTPAQKQKNKQQAAPVKKAAPQKSSAGGKKISPVQIAVMISGLLSVGVLIMWAAGLFGSAENTGSTFQQQQPETPAVSLENIQRINELEAAVKRDTTNLNTVLELAHLLNDSGMKERSVPYYQMYLRANPGNADVQVDLGVVYFEMQKYDIAKSRMRKGLALNPRHQIANFNMGIVNYSAGNLDSAKIWWNKALAIDPTSEIGKKAKELLDSHK